MTRSEIVSALRQFGTGQLCNASPDVRPMHSTIMPLYPGATLVGPAKTARIRPGQNAAIHRAVHTAQSGDVLVVDGGGDTRFGPFGDILATGCRNRGIAGAVIDSTVRDSTGIRDLQFPVFCLGTHPAATDKSDPGEIDVDVDCGGVRVRPGDLLVGDADGVVVIPQSIVPKVLDRATAVADREAQIMAGLSRGETTCEIFGIEIP